MSKVIALHEGRATVGDNAVEMMDNWNQGLEEHRKKYGVHHPLCNFFLDHIYVKDCSLCKGLNKEFPKTENLDEQIQERFPGVRKLS